MTDLEILAIIPARGGSKGIPRKNIRRLGDKPLIAYSILAGQQAKHVSRIVVSTEDAEIADQAQIWGADVVSRPIELAADEAATDPVLEQVVRYLKDSEGYRPDLVVLLQPTSPLRPPGLVDCCIERLLDTGSDSLLTVFEGHHFFWRRRGEGLEANYDPVYRPRRQEIPVQERILLENGSVYVTKTEIILEQHTRLAGKIEWYEMSPEDSLEIDAPIHFRMAEFLLETAQDADGI